MKFKVKDMDLSTGNILVAILNRKDAKKLDLWPGDRILLKHNHHQITCVLDISESKKAVPEGRIGLFEEVLSSLNVKSGQVISLEITGKPKSISHIRDKLKGKELSYRELHQIVDDITHDRLTDVEKTYFVAGSYTRGLTSNEIVHLTKAIVNTGKKLKFRGIILDKHCIGGVPGNRTTMIVIPIVAAAGFTIPKTSSRAITSSAGTADTMECLARVDLSERKIRNVVKKTKACLVHGGSLSLAPADDKIIEVEHSLSIDAEGQLLASVMAKKYSVSARHVLIDIPTGRGTKAESIRKAKYLRKMFLKIGQQLGINVKVVLTDGSHPIGNGIGPLLESRDVLTVLNNDPLAPRDLREKSLMLAGILLEMTGKYKHGRQVAEEILASGKALKKMKEIIFAQGKAKLPSLGQHRHFVKARKTGKIGQIDNLIITQVARIAGAPDDKGAGLFLHRKINEQVVKGELLYEIFAESKFKLDLAVKFLKKNNGYLVR